MTLFGEMVARLATHPENAASDSVQYILDRSLAARRSVKVLLGELGVATVGDLRFQREVAGESGERPDLAVWDESGSEVALIEAKFWAGFTANQPLAYLRRLRRSHPTALIFLLPDARLASGWAHISRTIVEAGIPLEERVTESPAIRCGNSETVVVAALSWRSLVARLELALTAEGEESMLEDVRQFRGLIDRLDRDQLLPLQTEDISSGIPRRQIHLLGLLDDVFEELAANGVCEKPPLRGGSDGGLFYGGSTSLQNVRFWMGLWYRPWRDLRETPYWMYLDRSEDQETTLRALLPLRANSPTALLEYDGSWVVPLNVPLGLEITEQVSGVVQQVRRVAELLRTATAGRTVDVRVGRSDADPTPA